MLRKPRPNNLLALSGILLLCANGPSCSSVTLRQDYADAIAQVDRNQIETHLHNLVALGPRRAGDPQAVIHTVAYLEDELTALGISTSREVFSLTPMSSAELHLRPEAGAADVYLIPGSYFSTITQARVVHGFAAAAGVRERLEGYSMVNAEAEPVEQINLFATIPGTIHPERILELSAHHDTVPGTVGANDNTSGVVVLLEVARLLKLTPPDCTVRLCFFAAEEIGLRGSQEHVRVMQQEDRLGQVFGLINLDTVGYYTDEEDSQSSPIRIPLIVWPPKTGNFLGILGGHGSAALAHLVEDAGDVYVEDLPTYSLARLGGLLPDARRSDHASYWDVGIPAIFLTDTAEFRSNDYHRPSDSLKNLDIASLRKVAMLTTASALVAAEQAAAN